MHWYYLLLIRYILYHNLCDLSALTKCVSSMQSIWFPVTKQRHRHNELGPSVLKNKSFSSTILQLNSSHKRLN